MGSEIALFAAIGFFAQMVDGALGMAFGVISSSALIASGAPPAIASAAVHAAETVTTGLSGASHVWHRNVNFKLFGQLTLAGVAGGVVGAYILTGLPEEIIKPIVTIYLLCMAVLIFARVMGRVRRDWKPPTPVLGASGAFLDAIGGGGWGPIVASTLIASGDEPRRSVGTVNLAEFFVTAAISVTFLLHLDLASYGRIVLGLVIGGALAAPLAGWLVKIVPQRSMLVMVGLVVGSLSAMNLIKLFT